MDNLDDLLQNQLHALERGDSPQPAGGEMEDLVALAQAARRLPHPHMPPGAVRKQQARLLAVARPVQPANKTLLQWLTTYRLPLAAGGAVLFFVLLIVGVIGATFLFRTTAQAARARLTGVEGLVEVVNADGRSEFISAETSLHQGETIRTYADSGAVLVFTDGSHTVLGADTQLTLTTLAGRGNTLRARLDQASGETTHNVIPLRGSGSFYEVYTPSGKAIVHGTYFAVSVGSDGTSLFSVNRGLVQVVGAQQEVFVSSGQGTAVLPGSNPTEPSYEFRLQGLVESISDSTWTVQGVPFTVTPETQISAEFGTGDAVNVKGRILTGGEWVADRIDPALQEQVKANFSGIIDTMPGVPGEWMISGKAVWVDETTERSGDLQVGDAVEVSFTVLEDGTWLAREIESLAEEVIPTPETTLTPEGTPQSTLTPEATATVEPKNDSMRCENRIDEHPDAARLAYKFNVMPEEIMGWFCMGFGFGEIDLAYDLSLQSGTPVAEIFAMRSGGMGWGAIKKELSPKPTPTEKIKPTKVEKTKKPKD